MTIRTVFPPSRFIAHTVVFPILYVVLSKDSSSFVLNHITIEGVHGKRSQAISHSAPPLVALCPLPCLRPNLTLVLKSKYGLGPLITHSKIRNLNGLLGQCYQWWLFKHERMRAARQLRILLRRAHKADVHAVATDKYTRENSGSSHRSKCARTCGIISCRRCDFLNSCSCSRCSWHVQWEAVAPRVRIPFAQ